MSNRAWSNADRGSKVLVILIGLIVVSTTADVTQAQTADAALRDRVTQLIERLGAEDAEARDAAQAALIKLGARALPLLPDPSAVPGDERKKRLQAVKSALLESADAAVGTDAMKITLQAQGIRLSEALRQFQTQSGNPLSDQREQLGAEVTNPSIDLDLKNLPFLEALDQLAAKAGVSLTYFTGDGSIGLMGPATPAKAPVVYNGPFRVTMRRFEILRDLTADTHLANVQFEVGWESRLRPMLLKLNLEKIKISDDQGRPIAANIKEESTDVVIRPENPAAELNVNLEAPDRSAKSLKSLVVEGDLTIPSGLRTFRFADITKENQTQAHENVKVTLESTEVDEQVWKIRVLVEYPGGGEAFESYRQGLFNNRLWLQTADGARFEHNGGFSNTSSAEGKLGFEYLFVDAPGKLKDYQFVYETPSAVKTIPLRFEFKDVALP